MDKEPNIDKLRMQMFINNPVMLIVNASAPLKYFKQLEHHLIDIGDEEGLTDLGATIGLPKTITDLEAILPSIESGNENVIKRAFILYNLLEGYQRKFKQLFPDFKPDYTKSY